MASLNHGSSNGFARHDDDPAFRLPPQNLECEAGVLGAVLIDAAAMNEVRDVLEVEDFYRDSHQTVYRILCGLYDAGGPIDALIVGDELTRLDKLGEVGGIEFIAELVNGVPHAANARYHADIVKQKATARKLIEAHTEGLREAYSNTMTAAELLESAERRVLAIGQAAVKDTSIKLGPAAALALDLVDARERGEVHGLNTGFDDLDDLLDGLQPERFYLLAARPSLGKSALAFNIAERASIEGGYPVLFVSLEMNKIELADRFLAARAGVDGYSLRYPRRLADGDRGRLAEACRLAARSRLVIDDPPHLTVGQLCARARRMKAREKGLGLVVVDYLQLVGSGLNSRNGNREQEIAYISRALKGLAKEIHVPVLAVCQLNRAVESRDDRKPRLADLRESGSLEQDADAVMLLHRPEFYDPSDEPGRAKVIIAKHRGGATGVVELGYDKTQCRFYNPTARPEDVPAVVDGPAF